VVRKTLLFNSSVVVVVVVVVVVIVTTIQQVAFCCYDNSTGRVLKRHWMDTLVNFLHQDSVYVIDTDQRTYNVVSSFLCCYEFQIFHILQVAIVEKEIEIEREREREPRAVAGE